MTKIMILDDHCSEEDRLLIQAELEEELDGPCEVTSYLASDEEQFRAFVVRLTGDELDFVLAPEKEIRDLEENSYFQEVYPIEDGVYYDLITDTENSSPEKHMYLGKTGRHEEKTEIQETVIRYFLEKKRE